jgi:thiol-disulfide isomerase/thioredoxin
VESALLLAARASLALVLGVSGAAKLADRAGSRRALLDFGTPAVVATPLALVLPVVELAIALALLPAVSARGAAACAFGLFLCFTIAIGWNLVRGRRPDCHCFGQLRSRPIGAGTVLRNVGLLGLAAWLAARPAPAWNAAPDLGVAGLTLLETVGLSAAILLGLGTIAEGWLLFHLLRQNGRLLERMDALERQHAGERPRRVEVGGALAPAFELPSFDGPAVSLDRLLSAGRPVLLVFVDPDCGPCRTLLPDVAGWQRTLGETLTVAVLTRGSEAAYRTNVAPLGIADVLVQSRENVAARYGATGTPAAVLIDPGGRIASPVASGAGEIHRLVQRITPPARAAPRGLAVGTPAPEVRLTALDGSAYDVGDRIGEATVLVFWNFNCGFCRQMLDDLRAWEAGGAGTLVMVASGATGPDAGSGLRSPVLIDPDFATGRAFGASGTPSAVLIGPDGAIASPLVVGASAVMGLLRGIDAGALPITVPASPPIPSPR